MIVVRRALEADCAFLARVILLATRAHLSRGWFDIMLDLSERQCLRFVEVLTRTSARSWWHHSQFWIADIGGAPAAALCCFRAGEAFPLSGEAIAEAISELGFSGDEQAAMSERGSYIFSCTVSGGDDVWTLENVATLPQYRRRGLTSALIEQAMDEGREHGNDRMQVSTLIGNEPAISAYRRLGFELVEEKRDAEFEAVAGAPGLCRFERAI
jgi:ribosomal protein S18 acetylase RimI-like enzyme